jgi:hypothetical protein
MSDLISDGDLACLDCNRILPTGSPSSTRLVAMADDGDTIAEIICVYCAHSPAEYAPNLADTLFG